MAGTDDDVISSWHDRVGSLRKPGRVTPAVLAVTPPRRLTFAVAAHRHWRG
jgi:hypothetical protein